MHLMIGTPCFGGLVSQRYMQSICNLLEFGNQAGLPISIELLGYDSLVTRSRNTIVATFLDHPTATHLMFIDADIGFAPDQVARMLALDEPVMAGLYPLKVINYGAEVLDRVRAGESLESAQLRYVGTPEPEDVRQEIDGFVTGEFAGAGFLMIRRDAMQAICDAHPELRAKMGDVSGGGASEAVMVFDTMVEPETGQYLSEDYAFCRRWRGIGGKLWLDLRSRLMHIGPREFAGDAGLRYRA